MRLDIQHISQKKQHAINNIIGSSQAQKNLPVNRKDKKMNTQKHNRMLFIACCFF